MSTKMQVINLNRRYPMNTGLLKRSLLKFRRRSRISLSCVDVILTDDGRIIELAARYRGVRRPTDVLAFHYGIGPRGEASSGEIVISLDTASRQAGERRSPLAFEVLMLSVHGLLHLSGEDDETESSWKRMKSLEFEAMMRML